MSKKKSKRSSLALPMSALSEEGSLASLALSPRVIAIPQRDDSPGKRSASNLSSLSVSSTSRSSPASTRRATRSQSALPTNPSDSKSELAAALSEPAKRKKEYVSQAMEDILMISGLPYYEVVQITEDLGKRIDRAADAVQWKKRKTSTEPLRDAKRTCLNVEQLMAVSRIRDSSQELLEYSRLRDAATTIQARVRGWMVRKKLGTLSAERKLVLLTYSRAVHELLGKESVYLESLNCLVDNYLLPMEDGSVVGSKERALIFGNVREIVGVQKGAHRKLSRILDKWPFVSGVGKALLKVAPSLTVYGPYVANFNNAQSGMQRLKKEKSSFNRWVTETDRDKGLSLASLLSQPVNHIAKFSADLKILLSLAPSEQESSVLETAIQLYEDAGQHIKEALIGADTSESIVSVQRRIDGSEQLDLVRPDRVLIDQGEVMMEVPRKSDKAGLKLAPHTIFLFNDLLLITSEKKDKKLIKKKAKAGTLPMLQVVAQVPLKKLETTEVEDDAKFVVGDGKQTFVFSAKSPENQGMWKSHINGCIERRDAQRVFGVPLMEVLEKENRIDSGVPVIVEKCMAFLRSEREGLETQGLFRISGMKGDLDELQEMFDTKEEDEITLEGRDIHAVAGTLLLWLREFPEPLLGFDMFEPLINSLNASEMCVGTKELLRDIKCRSPCHMKLFRTLVFFWRDLTLHSEVNKMSPSNIAIVVAPNILRPRVETIETALRSPLANQVIESIVEDCDAIFADFDSW
eukprot:TRINITY_DN2956_c1_g2_i1.p1 TRINITY_DN2956_c1_g2~~TRINITY_DN2956_c1_g2_i1.p1  ORF type:complete len:747 (-),score=262.67 TRINITY_DN2956_c1_g2_i1:126-2366(-)